MACKFQLVAMSVVLCTLFSCHFSVIVITEVAVTASGLAIGSISAAGAPAVILGIAVGGAIVIGTAAGAYIIYKHLQKKRKIA